MATITKHLQIGKGSNGGGDSLGDAYNTLANALSDIFTSNLSDDTTLLVDGSVSTTETISALIQHNPVTFTGGSLLIEPASGYEPTGTGPQMHFAFSGSGNLMEVNGEGGITWKGFKFSTDQTGNFAYLIRYSQDSFLGCEIEFGGRQAPVANGYDMTIKRCLFRKTGTGWPRFIDMNNTTGASTVAHNTFVAEATVSATGEPLINLAGSNQVITLSNNAFFMPSGSWNLTDQTGGLAVGANNARTASIDSNLGSVDWAVTDLTDTDADDFVEPSTGDWRAAGSPGALAGAGSAGVDTEDMFGTAYDASTPDIGFFQNATADAEAPTTPGNLRTTGNTHDQIDLAWDASTDNVGVDHYKLYTVWPTAGVIATQPGLTFSHTGLIPDTQYTYSVAAFDAAGNSSTLSPTLDVTTDSPPDTTAPTVPTGLTETAVSQTTCSLSWTASTDAVGVTGYRVFRDAVEIGTTASTSYSDTGLTADTAYDYTVAAYDAAANESAQSSALTITTDPVVDVAAPDVPSPTAAPAGTSRALIEWPAVTDNGGGSVAGYKVYRGGVEIADTTELFLIDTGLTAQTAYTYTVSAYDDASPANESAQSAGQDITTWQYEYEDAAAQHSTSYTYGVQSENSTSNTSAVTEAAEVTTPDWPAPSKPGAIT